MGKVLLEKVLFSLDIKKIRLLVRKKKNKTPNDRMRQIFSSHVFIRLKRKFEDNASFEHFLSEKIELVTGDLTLPALGLAEDDHERVIRDTHMIINSAASVKFDDPIREALEINFFGAQRILELAK